MRYCFLEEASQICHTRLFHHLIKQTASLSMKQLPLNLVNTLLTKQKGKTSKCNNFITKQYLTLSMTNPWGITCHGATVERVSPGQRATKKIHHISIPKVHERNHIAPNDIAYQFKLATSLMQPHIYFDNSEIIFATFYHKDNSISLHAYFICERVYDWFTLTSAVMIQVPRWTHINEVENQI